MKQIKSRKVHEQIKTSKGIYLTIRLKELTSFSSIDFVKNKATYFFSIVKFWTSSLRYFIMFSNKPVSKFVKNTTFGLSGKMIAQLRKIFLKYQ